jgi:phenylalanyl-tRNA synthetase beta chain
MRILHSWIQQYITFKFTPEELSEKLGMLGLEIEGFERLGQKYDGFVVGRVLERSAHPNADKLSVCIVDVGKERLQVVCGAPNVAIGQMVAVGLVGAAVPKNQHDPAGKPFVLTKAKIRGVESSGMICSEYELDLGPDAGGIVVLESSARVGQPLAEYFGLNDIAYDVEVTPNRPDWLSHFGVAREIGVLVGKEPHLPRIKLSEAREQTSKFISVKNESAKDCSRFAVRMVRGAHIGPSPQWLQNALRNVGLRPRNNVVDVTNYVMMECGQPLHAFDYSKLKGRTLIVRSTKQPVSLQTLDGEKRDLPVGSVVVCDAEREVSLAGIMGGGNSEIEETTTDIVLEAAHWNPSAIRRTAKALGITTDASQRFERGADASVIPYALNRAGHIIADLTRGSLLRGMVDVKPQPIKHKVVSLRPSRVNSVLGTNIPLQDVTRFLRRLGISPVRKGDDRMVCKIPSYRVDVEREIDLIEEVARVFGYDRVEAKTTVHLDVAHPFPKSDITAVARTALIGLGFQEALTNAMQDGSTSALGGKEPIRVVNPHTKETETLRTSLIPGLLRAVAHNRNYGNADLRLFEIGKVFSIDHTTKPKFVDGFLEENHLCLIMTGRAFPLHWDNPDRLVDIFDLKGEVSALLRILGLDKGTFISYSTDAGLAENPLAIEINGGNIGYLGFARTSLLQPLDIENPVLVADINLESIGGKRVVRHVALPRFPAVKRDVAFVVASDTSASDVECSIVRSASLLLHKVELFDVYEGSSLPTGKKSLAFSLELLSHEKTLTESEIETEVRTIVNGVARDVGATLRSI